MKPEDSEKKSWRHFKKLDFKPVDKRARTIEKTTIRHAHKFVISRFANLRSIRRHVIGWLVLISILIALAGVQMSLNYTSLSKMAPSGGGTYAEGIVDSINTLNPLFASSQAEVSADRLIFGSLLQYDGQGHLQPDLAESWNIQDAGRKYLITLRPGLTWHDGKPLTAQDVVFTVHALQDPRVGALARQGWQDIRVEAKDDTTVVFTLPGPYAPFASALTFAVLPRHILESIAPESLQESEFSKKPIGSGPFRYVSTKTIDITKGKTAVQLDSFDDYWKGRPNVGRFSLYTYSEQKDLLKGLTSHEVNAASEVPASSIKQLRSIGFNENKALLNSGVYGIFRNDNEALKDVKVRQALVSGFDNAYLRRQLGESALGGPIVNTQLPKANQVSQAAYDQEKAEKLLDEAGWIKDVKGKRMKNGQPLELRLVSVDTSDYRVIVDELAQQWSRLGISFQKQLIDPEQVQQTVLRPRAYDVLVYELELGGDPDGYAYWHSSQRSGIGLNFANYSSGVADDALTTARLRTDWGLRDAKYTSFARAWVKDAPAIALYQPNLRYVTARNIKALKANEHLASPADRYNSVELWTVQDQPQNLTP